MIVELACMFIGGAVVAGVAVDVIRESNNKKAEKFTALENKLSKILYSLQECESDVSFLTERNNRLEQENETLKTLLKLHERHERDLRNRINFSEEQLKHLKEEQKEKDIKEEETIENG